MPTPRLGAPELPPSQALPEATVNEQIRYVEQGAGAFAFKDRDLAIPPVSPADGDCYLVAAGPTGAWTGQAGKIAFFLNTAWAFITAKEGMTAWVNDEDVRIRYDGAAWGTLGAGDMLAANNLSDVASKVAAKDNISIKGADIASAATTNLATATGDFVDVTGTTTITALGTAAAGVERVVRFTGILTLTHNATSLILPTGASIVTAAGDVARFRSLGAGNWVCVGYIRASGQALAAYTDENARDAIGIALQATSGGGLSVTVDDALDTIKVAQACAINPQVGTTYTAVLSDGCGRVTFSNAAAITFTIPPNSSVAFPIGTWIEGEQIGAGSVTPTAGAGVTIRNRTGYDVSAGQYAVIGLRKVETDTWSLTGDLV